MTSSKDVDLVYEAAAALAARPGDLDAWWRLGHALAIAERSREARDSDAALGRAASALGSVALAVACARRLELAGAEREASKLIDRIAKAYCKGEKRVDVALRRVPPSLPVADAEPAEAAEAPADLDSAASLAKRAIDAATKASRQRAPKKLPPTPLLGGLAPEDLGELVSVMSLREQVRGDVLLDVGEPATALFWLCRGGAEVSRGDRLLGELRAGSFFGEIALVGGTTRTARVACLEDCVLLEIPAVAVEKLAEKAPRLARVLAGYARSRLLSNVMRTSELFSRLSADERRDLLHSFEAELVPAGDAIVREGEDNDHLYVVASGSFEVRRDDELLATLEVGDGVGEVSVLGRKAATADVIACEPSVVLRLGRDRFDEIAVAHPGLLAEVYKLLIERERNSDALVHDATDLIL